MGLEEGSLWTGCIYDHKKMREMFPNTRLICVMRWPPRYISLKKENIGHMLSFAPSVRLMQWCKKKLSEKPEDDAPATPFQEFLRKFYEEFRRNAMATDDRFKIRRALQKGESIALLCHEKAGKDCHRKMVAYLILNDGEEDVYKGEMKFEPEIVQGKLDWW